MVIPKGKGTNLEITQSMSPSSPSFFPLDEEEETRKHKDQAGKESDTEGREDDDEEGDEEELVFCILKQRRFWFVNSCSIWLTA